MDIEEKTYSMLCSGGGDTDSSSTDADFSTDDPAAGMSSVGQDDDTFDEGDSFSDTSADGGYGTAGEGDSSLSEGDVDPSRGDALFGETLDEGDVGTATPTASEAGRLAVPAGAARTSVGPVYGARLAFNVLASYNRMRPASGLLNQSPSASNITSGSTNLGDMDDSETNYFPMASQNVFTPPSSVSQSSAQRFLDNTPSLLGSNTTFTDRYAQAKSKVEAVLNTPSSIGQTATTENPFYNFLNINNLNRGIL